MKQLKVFLKLLPYIKYVHSSILAGIVTGTLSQLAAIAGSAAGAYLVSRAILGTEKRIMLIGIFALLALVVLKTAFSYLEMYYAHKAA